MTPEGTPPEIFQSISAIEAAEHRAYKRGQDAAALEGRLEQHYVEDDRRFNEIKTDLHSTTETLKTVASKVDSLGEQVQTAGAVAAARAQDAANRAKDAKEATEEQVSTRTFVIGLLGLGAAILTALGASGHL